MKSLSKSGLRIKIPGGINIVIFPYWHKITLHHLFSKSMECLFVTTKNINIYLLLHFLNICFSLFLIHSLSSKYQCGAVLCFAVCVLLKSYFSPQIAFSLYLTSDTFLLSFITLTYIAAFRVTILGHIRDSRLAALVCHP